MGIRTRLNYTALFVLGSVMGLTGFSFYSGEKITAVSHLVRDEVAQTISGDSVALACMNHEEAESIFFVSCGGTF